MPKIGYDLKNLDHAMAALRSSPNSQSNLTRLRKELNNFFTEATCINVFYTKNSDKLFFGMAVYPSLTDEQVSAIALGDGDDKDAIRVTQYSIDIDSKLFDEIMLTDRELTAIILHEIGHLVADDSPAKIVQRNMDDFFRKERTNIDANQMSYSIDLIRFALEDAMVKSVSLWYRDDEVAADSFVVSCGYGYELQSALKKVGSSAFSLAKGADIPKYTMLCWALRLYKNIHTKRVPAIKTLDRAIALSGSTLQKNKMSFLKKRLMNYVAPLAAVKGDVKNPITDVEVSESVDMMLHENKLFNSLKASGLRSIENDYYEYQMRINNVEDESEAIQMLREINNRLTMLDNYTASNKLNNQDRKRYSDLYNKYLALREILSKKKVYRKANYGLFYNYNDLTDAQKQSYEPT